MKLGLVFRQGRFMWSPHTWYWWIPGQHVVVHLWNWIACRIWGHEDDLWHVFKAGELGEEDAVCYNCCKRLTKCVGHEEMTDS